MKTHSTLPEYNYELLYILACIEGELLAVRAANYPQKYIAHVTYVVGYDFGWRGLRHTQCVSAACIEVYAAIHTLAKAINGNEWVEGIAQGEFERSEYEKYERMCEAESTDNHDDAIGKIIEVNGIFYDRLRGTPDPGEGYCYVQQSMNADDNYSIRKFSGVAADNKLISVVKEQSDAIAIAHYAASNLGGYGDVVVMSSQKSITHNSFEDWFLN